MPSRREANVAAPVERFVIIDPNPSEVVPLAERIGVAKARWLWVRFRAVEDVAEPRTQEPQIPARRDPAASSQREL